MPTGHQRHTGGENIWMPESENKIHKEDRSGAKRRKKKEALIWGVYIEG